ncbi:mitochondrial import inner membrane translocase subunit tim54 [Ceratobasidium sp. 414]|nr:mitochondrial import inner membrane translocase subunit tim54 [Ceratobasidium sp. 414]
MASSEAPKVPPAADVTLKTSGAASALRYTGIPPSWFQKRPKLPSRNWLIFWTVLGSVTSLYVYDRREAKKIRQDYVQRVQWRAEEKLGPLELPRKVRVYGCRWPGDDDYNRSMKYFRKYVKPILVAAAIDFEMVNGNRHSGLARSIADKIKLQRREVLPADHPLRHKEASSSIPLPTAGTPAQQRERELQGGVIIIGRHTLKEYMHGLRLGWSEGLGAMDREEALARRLASDGALDEPEPLEDPVSSVTPEEPHILDVPSRIPSGPKSPLYSPIIAPPKLRTPQSPIQQSQAPQARYNDSMPQTIPPQPPLLLLPFTNLLGFRYIPHMIIDFFNERKRVRAGAEAACALVEGQTREFTPPVSDVDRTELLTVSSLEDELKSNLSSLPDVGPQGGDLDFDRSNEVYFRKNYNKVPKEIADARKKYYEGLSSKLAVARSLARNEREPTKEEREHPPPTEVELTTERFKKELKWCEDLEGWKILRAGSGVDWDSRLASALQVYVSPSSTSFS